MTTLGTWLLIFLVVGTCYVASFRRLQEEHRTETHMEQQVKEDQYWDDVRKEIGQ